MNNREAFEAWAKKELLPLDRRDSEHYRYNLTNRAWAGWKAGLASQAKRIDELEAATEHLGLTPQQAADGLVRHKAQVALIESLRKQVEELQISANRYEKLRRLNAYQFQNIFKTNITSCIRFDELVDNLPASKNGE